jgi:hypothetical protein
MVAYVGHVSGPVGRPLTYLPDTGTVNIEAAQDITLNQTAEAQVTGVVGIEAVQGISLDQTAGAQVTGVVGIEAVQDIALDQTAGATAVGTALNFVTLTLDVYTGNGVPITEGTAFFSPTTPLTDHADHLSVWQTPVPVPLEPPAGAEEGWRPTVSLYATDSTNISPSGWKWMVTFYTPGAPAPFTFSLPFANGSEQYLSAVAA